MAMDWTDDIESVDWDELAELYRLAPLGTKDPGRLRTAFSNSMFRVFVRDAGRLVGVGRVLADGADCAYICDVAVLPSHQGSGLGKRIVARLVELSQGHRKILLYSVPGKEAFYRKFGFLRMKTAMGLFEQARLMCERNYLEAD